jgi:hypothetical protein
MYSSVQLLDFVHSLDRAMDTKANFANSSVARTDVAVFIKWVETRRELSREDKERLARLVEDFRKDPRK